MNVLLLHDQCLQFPAASRFVLLQVGHPLTLSRAMKAAVHGIKHAKEEVRNEGFRLACACHACMGRTLTDEALLEKKEIEYEKWLTQLTVRTFRQLNLHRHIKHFSHTHASNLLASLAHFSPKPRSRH